MKNFGIPYQGSKNTIAEDIINVLPSGKRFIDLFGGGGAMSHAAKLSNKYEKVVYNEIDKCVADFIKEPLKYLTYEWISRDRFFAEKDSNGFIKLIYSFCNNGIDYLFSKNEEELHRFAHITNAGGIRKQEFERIKRILYFIPPDEVYSCSYDEFKFEDGDVIYCDIPYQNTKGYYNNKFDHEKFRNWCLNLGRKVFISSYELDFGKCIWEKKKQVNLGNVGLKKIERLYEI